MLFLFKKKNSFINLIYFLILFTFSSLRADVYEVPGKKIKKTKSRVKNEIKANIINTISFLKHESSLPKEKNRGEGLIEKLSQSAKDRYLLHNNYVIGDASKLNIVAPDTILSLANSISFFQKNYNYIKGFMIKHNIQLHSIFNAAFLIHVNNLIKLGWGLQSSLYKALTYLHLYNCFNNGILKGLYRLKNQVYDASDEQKEIFDNKAKVMLNNILLFNGSNKIERDRAINRLYNNANRKSAILIIEKYDKNDVSFLEPNNTYGELAPSKDIYEKVLFKKSVLEDAEMRDRFSLRRREMPEITPKNIDFFTIIPKINNNIVEYYVLDEGDENKLEIKKIEALINALDENAVYCLSIVTDYLF
jgi:hypothetical protein